MEENNRNQMQSSLLSNEESQPQQNQQINIGIEVNQAENNQFNIQGSVCSESCDLESIKISTEEQLPSQIENQQQDFTMSKDFLLVFKQNVIYIIMAIITDAIFGLISLLIDKYHCKESDLQYWNQQWGYLFITKSVYSFLISLQYISKRRKQYICEKLGEYRSESENNIIDSQYEINYTPNQRNQIRNYYEKRTTPLKWIYNIKQLTTVSYILYGIIVFSKGGYFDMVSNTFKDQNNPCELGLAWWVYISLVLVGIFNSEIFNLLVSLIIIIPLMILIVLPYAIHECCKQRKQQKQLLDSFKHVKYSIGIIEGDPECSICKMDYIIDEDITILSCNNLHHFHKDCIQSWLAVKMNCPLCRHDFSHLFENANQNVNQNVNENNNNQPILYVPPQNNPNIQE